MSLYNKAIGKDYKCLMFYPMVSDECLERHDDSSSEDELTADINYDAPNSRSEESCSIGHLEEIIDLDDDASTAALGGK